MQKDDSLLKVLVIFLGITLVGSSFSAVSAQVPPPVPGDFLNDFVSSGSGGLNVPKNLVFGPDGNLYVISFAHDKIKRYDGITGAYIDTFVGAASGGLDAPQGLEFGPDGNLYVTSEYTNEILRYDGSSGSFIDVFASGGGLSNPQEAIFGPDGNLYVTNYFTHDVLRFDGTTGAFIDVFVPSGSGGLDTAQGLEFGPDGNLYVVSENNPKVLRYDGATGSFIDAFATVGGGSSPKDLAFGPDGNLYVTVNTNDKVKSFDGTTGALINSNFVASGSGGLNSPQGLVMGPDGHLYVTSQSTNEILRYVGPLGITAFCNGVPATIQGTTGDDTIVGTTGDDVIVGLDGDDFIDSLGGNDIICGDLGDDDVYGGAGNDTIDAGDGDNIVHGESGNDTITSGSGDDNIYGGDGHDTIIAGNGQNYIEGNQKDDIIITGTGQDEIYGGDGSDTITAGDGQNYVEGNQRDDIISTGSGDDTIYGGSGDDTITAGDGSNNVHGENGHDIINTGSGDDDIYGGTGDDTINASDGSNHVHGENGNDVISTGSGDDDVEGNNGDDCINTGGGSDTIDGGSGNNLINTGSCDFPPTVSITTPADGDNYTEGDSITFSGSATDPDDGGISNLIRWTSDDDGLIGIGDSITNSSLSVGSHVITATVTDSFGNTDSDSHSIMVNAAPVDALPSVSITTPADGDNYTEGDSITFSGSATDPEDGGISNLIRWTSDDDGLIGIGDSITNSSLSVGSHVITATVTDSFGNTDSDSHSIMVTGIVPTEAVKPILECVEDLGGGNYRAHFGYLNQNSEVITINIGSENKFTPSPQDKGQPTTFEVGRTDYYPDAEFSIDFDGSNLVWSLKGPDGNNRTVTASSNPAQACPEDTKPSVSITTPSDSDSFINGTSITFSGNATDLEDGDLSSVISWTSNFNGHLGNGNSITNSSLSIGTHTIRASVTDSYGNIESDSIMIEITEDNALEQKLKDDEYEEKVLIEKIKKQREETKNKNELKEKRQALKEIKKEFRDFKKELKSVEKEKIKDLVEEIKEVIKKLKEDPEYDKELKQVLKNELKETKLKIKQEMKTKEKLYKNKIDSKVHSLTRSDSPDHDAKKLGFDFKDGKTKIVVKLSDDDSEVVEHLSSIGKVNMKNDKHVQLTVKVSDLPKLNSIQGIDKIRSPFSAVQFYEELSEGVYFINADLVQFAGITGKGIKAAVLDLAFTDNEKISDNVVQVKSFRQGIGYLPIQGSGDEASHGTAVAEIITDVAPDVELYLYSMETDIEFIAAVDEAISQQVDVIAMSAGWPNFPTDGTSHITQKIEEAVDNGIVFVVPSGNFANKHWEGNFVDSNFNNWHEYSNSDEGLSITVTEERIAEEKPIISYLMWDVGMGEMADFEMVLVDPLGQIVDYSANEQVTKSDTPFEYIHHIPDTEGTYSIGILYAGDMSEVSKRPNVSLEIFSVNDELEHPVTLSSVSVPADAEGAIVVGAVDHLDGTLQPFSSQGPTNDGKLAPHVVGPDGVTTLALGDKPFYGTSATTPYVAGIAALMLQSNPDMTPEQIINKIQENTDSSIFSLEDGYDYSTGYGAASAFFLLEDSEVIE